MSGTNPHAAPPFSQHDLSTVVGHLRDLLGDDSVVMIGGAAVAFWHSQLQNDVVITLLATRDLDFIGSCEDVDRAAALLGGEARLTKFEEHTTQAGEVHFYDDAGRLRAIDFLRHPYGLDAQDVVARAIPFDCPVPGAGAVRLQLMHPLDCLRSRIANNALTGRDQEHAHAQLRAAIALVPAYSRELLDQGLPVRNVLRINQEIYDIALDRRSPLSHQALRLYREDGIDIEQAVLRDPRLPDAHLDVRLPQLARQLAQRRATIAPTDGATN